MLNELRLELRETGDPVRAKHSLKFFKTGPGEYAEGDKFIGNNVPTLRKIAKSYSDLSISDTTTLLKSEWHEERLTALFIIVHQFQKGDEKTRKNIYDLYISNTHYVNNWDLVDSSAHKIVGPYLANKEEKMTVLTKLAKSELLWDRRLAIISTMYYCDHNSAIETIEIAEILLHDNEDLIHKAVGWLLRVVGYKVDEEILLRFLDTHAHEMPRTMLRYSIERFDEQKRKKYLQMKV